jgi:D-glycero-beta-D-manno-heptose-7-phosphate kinase
VNQNLIDQFFHDTRNQTILVVGDVMVDAYLWGRVDRISPEAPVPVVHVERKESRLGGAANVALNLKSLGAKVIMCSVVGDSNSNSNFFEACEAEGFSLEGLVESKERITTVKTRVISGGHHIVRVDEEMVAPISKNEEFELLNRVKEILNGKDISAVVFEDYNKGVLTSFVIEEITKLANHKAIPIAVDPKLNNFLAYRNCTLFKPNMKELKEGLQRDFSVQDEEEIKNAIEVLQEQLNAKWVLVTRSEFGVMGKSSEGFVKYSAHKREIVDVSGAGDTVIAVATLAMAMKWELKDVAFLSNLAGGLVCEKVGVVPIYTEELKEELKKIFA